MWSRILSFAKCKSTERPLLYVSSVSCSFTWYSIDLLWPIVCFLKKFNFHSMCVGCNKRQRSKMYKKHFRYLRKNDGKKRWLENIWCDKFNHAEPFIWCASLNIEWHLIFSFNIEISIKRNCPFSLSYICDVCNSIKSFILSLDLLNI